MALTKINWYLIVILVVGIVFTSLLIFGDDIANTDVALDGDSYDYINEYAVYMGGSGLQNITEIDVVDLKEDQLLSEENSTSSVSDFLANLNFYKKVVQPIINKVKLVMNFPTLMLQVTGLPLSEFRHIINIFGWLLFTTLLIVFIRLVRGS